MKRERIGRLVRGTEGSIAILSALGLVVLLGFASLAIDMGHLYTVRNELQNSADAAALAAAGSLVKYSSGVAVRDSNAAQQAAMSVAQRQSQVTGLPAAATGARNDLTVLIGEWNLAVSPDAAWTEIGTSCGSSSNANAVRVTLRRGSGVAYGPVTNFFAGIFGDSSKTSEVSASATAYLGYTNEVQTGAVQVPLSLPSTILTASNGHSGWFASLFAPGEVVASATKTLVFKDTGGANVTNTVPTSPVATLDPNQAYFYTVGSGDAVPDTMNNILTKVYNKSYTASTPVLVADLKRSQQIYPRSEYPWGRSNIGPLFQNLQKAYYFKTTGSATKAPPAGTAWRTTLAVHGLRSTASLPRKGDFTPLARLLTLLSPTQAYACTTITYPTIEVKGFVNADITGVTYNSSSCDDCSYTFPKTIAGHKYKNKKECLAGLPTSSWNANTVTITNITDASTISPPGSLSGGPSNDTINPGASHVGALATVPCLVK